MVSDRDDDGRLNLWDYIVVLWPFILGGVAMLVGLLLLIHWGVTSYEHHGLIECRRVDADLWRCK